jgi:hypothetical protein
VLPPSARVTSKMKAGIQMSSASTRPRWIRNASFLVALTETTLFRADGHDNAARRTPSSPIPTSTEPLSDLATLPVLPVRRSSEGMGTPNNLDNLKPEVTR